MPYRKQSILGMLFPDIHVLRCGRDRAIPCIALLQYLLCRGLHLLICPIFLLLSGEVIELCAETGQELGIKIHTLLVVKGFNQIHHIIRHGNGSVHRNLIKMNIHASADIIDRGLRVFRITAHPGSDLSSLSLEITVGLIFIEPVRNIISGHSIQSDIGKKIIRCKKILLETFPQSLLAHLFPHLERDHLLRSIGTVYPGSQNQAGITVGTSKCGSIFIIDQFTAAVRTEDHLILVTFRTLFTVRAVTIGTKHSLLLRIIHHISAAIGTLVKHMAILSSQKAILVIYNNIV